MAILTKAQLEALNQSSFPDQSTEAITPAILRNYNTQTIDTLVDSLDTGSFIQDLTSLNAFTASQLTINSGLNASTASQQVSINNLNSATASYDAKFATIGTQSGSWGGGTGQVTSASFNAYTASTDSSISQLNASSASQQISINNLNSTTASLNSSITNLNSTTASINSSITQLNASSASQQISINALNAATASYITTPLTSLNAYTASNDTKWSTLGGQTGSYVTSAITASSLITASVSGQTMTFTKGNGTTFDVTLPAGSGSSTIPTGTVSSSAQITALGFVSSSVTASSLITASVNLNTITFTKGDASTFNITVNTGSGGGTTDISSLNAFTASQETKNSTLASVTASLNANTASQQSQINSLIAATGSYALTSSIVPLTSLNAFTASQETKDTTLASVTSSLNSATASLFASASLGLTTASFSGNTLTFRKGDNTTFGVVIPDVSGSGVPTGTVSSSAQITALGFVSSSVTASSLVNAYSNFNNITFVRGDGATFNVTVDTGSAASLPAGTVSSSAQILDYGIFATTGSNSFVGDEEITGSLKVTYTGNTGNPLLDVSQTQIRLNGGSSNPLEITNVGDVKIVAGGGSPFNNLEVFAGILQYSSSTYQSQNLLQTTKIYGSLTASLQEGYVWVGDSTNTSTLVATSSFGGGTTDLTSLNAFTASQDTKNATLASVTASLNANTASQQSQINSLIAATASFATTGSNTFFGTNSFSGAVSFTGSAPTILSQSFSGSLITNLTDTYTDVARVNQIVTLTSASYAALASGSLTNPNTLYVVSGSSGGTTIPAGTISGSQQITDLGFVSSSVTASSLVTASFSGNTLTFTKGDNTTFGIVIPDVSGSTINTGSFVTTSSFNDYTSSNDQRVSSLEANSASVNTSISNINSATASLFTSTSLAIVTASVNNDDITFTKGDGTQFTIQVATGSFAATSSLAENALDIVVNVKNTTGVQINKGTVVRIIGATGDNPLIQTASWDNDSTSANTLGFVVTDIPNDSFGRVITQGTLLSVDTDPALGYTAGQLLYLSSSGQYTNIAPPAPFHEVRLGQVLRAQQNNGSIYVLVQNGYELSELHDVDINTGSLANNDLLAYNSSTTQWENKSISTLGLATTGSNVFIGDETFQDGSGNASTISPYSGSFVLVSKTVTSGSAGLSFITSSANLVNLIFKTNNVLSGSITISGSSNIINTPSAPTAGFRRQISANNILLTGVSPEITSSIAFPVSISGNYANNIIRFRGPVSSSVWSISNNIVNANFNIGNADATSANQAIAGGNISNNVLLASVNYNAYTTPLVAQSVYQSNLSVGTATLTAFSSSISANNNILNGNTFTVNNRYYGTSSTAAAQRLALSYNVLGGINSSTLTVEGSNTTAGAPREVIGNTTNGSGILLGAVLSGDNSNLYSTIVHGSNLTVTGSSAYNNYSTGGSTFIGRNNAVDGTKARSGETIFAVGTGTSTSTRKTGFLIDSGSNTFVEGTLNVSGSTSFNGVVNITGSLTSSLTEGYVWVGGAGNISTLAATSSFGGATLPSGLLSSSVTNFTDYSASVDSRINAITASGGIPAGTVSSSAQILNYGIFATTGSNTFTGTQTIQVADLITNGAVYFNGSPFDGGVPIDNLARWVITPGGTQFSQNFTSNSSANTNGVTVLYNNSTSSFESSISITAQQSGSQSNVTITNNSGSTNIGLNASTIQLSGSIQLPSGTDKPAGIVSVNGSATVTNSLVTSNSIILVTTQNGVVAGTKYPSVVTGKTAGSFTIEHNYSGNLSVGYLIINPI